MAGNIDKFEPYRSLPEWPCGAGMPAKCWHYRLSFRDLESTLRSVSFLDPRVEAVDRDATPTRIVTKVVDTRCLARIISRKDLPWLSDRAAFA